MKADMHEGATEAALAPTGTRGCDRACGRTKLVVYVTVLGLLALGWFLRAPIQRTIAERLILANQAPNPETVTAMILEAADPGQTLLAAWNGGGIVHRQAAIRSLPRVVPAEAEIPAELESLVVAAALDPDYPVRQAALGILRDRNHADYFPLVSEQLHDVDPELRMLGLDHLRRAPAVVGIPAIIGLLDDPDPMVVTMSVKLLEKWSGQDFGVRLSNAVPLANKQTGLKEYSQQSREQARAGATRARAWLAAHEAEWRPPEPTPFQTAMTTRKPVPAPDFSLRALDGTRVRLRDLRGKVVLLNFWTTWCTACVGEMPALIELRRRHPEDLEIIGVSLDFVPDSHGHIGGHPAVEEQGESIGHHEDHEPTAATLERVRQKVQRTAKSRGVNYPVLLDEKNDVGGRYNGGELPTTVIIDAEGNVRRRFVGARSLEVFEAMIAEASTPWDQAGLR